MGDRRKRISRHRQLCVLFVFIIIIISRGFIILLVLRRHCSKMCCFVFIIYIIIILFISQKTNKNKLEVNRVAELCMTRIPARMKTENGQFLDGVNISILCEDKICIVNMKKEKKKNATLSSILLC